jgi:tripartite-type tricarboxylate transporter receptor subunit TctC
LHADTPAILDLVAAPEDRQIVQLVLDRMTLGRPFIAPPGIAADRVALLRQAFRQAIEDPELLAEARKQRLAIKPTFGEEAERVIRQLYDTPPQVLARARKIVAVAPGQ